MDAAQTEDAATASSAPEIDGGDTNEVTMAAAAAAAAVAAAVTASDVLLHDILTSSDAHEQELQPQPKPEQQDQEQHQEQHHPNEEPDVEAREQGHKNTAAGMKRKYPEQFHVTEITQQKHRYKHRAKFPPPSPELIIGYNDNDVLCGRGATINAHPGNQVFREMCANKKSEFVKATNAQKRQIATEVVEEIMNLDPPGRFLERVEAVDAIDLDALRAAAGDRAADVERIFLGGGDYGDQERGAAVLSKKKDRQLRATLGPFRDIGKEKAVQKVCGVIRDHKRPDRIALRAMGLLKKKAPKPKGLDVLNENEQNPAETSEIVPTANDVILGRGAFINDHPGNRRFRQLALERKARFDAGSASEKRAISIEMYDATKELNPPGRFIKRASHALSRPIHVGGDLKYKLPPRGLEGPWEEISEEKAVAKACQVLRDLKIKPEEIAEMVVQHHEHLEHEHQLAMEEAMHHQHVHDAALLHATEYPHHHSHDDENAHLEHPQEEQFEHHHEVAERDHHHPDLAGKTEHAENATDVEQQQHMQAHADEEQLASESHTAIQI